MSTKFAIRGQSNLRGNVKITAGNIHCIVKIIFWLTLLVIRCNVCASACRPEKTPNVKNCTQVICTERIRTTIKEDAQQRFLQQLKQEKLTKRVMKGIKGQAKNVSEVTLFCTFDPKGKELFQISNSAQLSELGLLFNGSTTTVTEPLLPEVREVEPKVEDKTDHNATSYWEEMLQFFVTRVREIASQDKGTPFSEGAKLRLRKLCFELFEPGKMETVRKRRSVRLKRLALRECTQSQCFSLKDELIVGYFLCFLLSFTCIVIIITVTFGPIVKHATNKCLNFGYLPLSQ